MIETIRDLEGLERAIARPEGCLLFKHSTRCPGSARAAEEVDRFAGRHPEVPIGRILVVEDRPVSNEAARRLGVVHQSPQAILVIGGAPAWSASHAAVTAGSLERVWGEKRRATAAPPGRQDPATTPG